MKENLFQTGLIVSIFSAGIRLATPYLLASIGEMLDQRSGVYNLGIEGIMLIGAFLSFYTSLKTGSLMLGILMAIIVGLLMGLLSAFINVTMKAEQGISGIGIYMFGFGLSGLLFRLTMGAIVTIDGFKSIPIPILSKMPYIGEIFFNQNWMVYLAFLLVPISYIVLFKTTFGLKIRSVGENPSAADSLGVSVEFVRYVCIIIGSVLAALAGAFLTIGQQKAIFVENISAGRGFIAIALVYFGRWQPTGVMIGSLLFSILDALQIRVQIANIGIPYEYAVMAPYIITIIVLVFVAQQRIGGPTALGKPFERCK
jgi:simple sugar transport system permease protein